MSQPFLNLIHMFKISTDSLYFFLEILAHLQISSTHTHIFTFIKLSMKAYLTLKVSEIVDILHLTKA